ncbi:MAG: hypothetical protein KUL88_04385 [Rhizobium sp.]|nr:hypothetical protein [Rhizobium sp.]
MSDVTSGSRAAARLGLKAVRLALTATAIEPRERRAAELYLLVTGLGVNQVLAAEVAGCTKQNVSKLVASVEDRREDGAFDRQLAALERAILGE